MTLAHKAYDISTQWILHENPKTASRRQKKLKINAYKKAVSIVNTVTDGDARAMHGARLSPFKGNLRKRSGYATGVMPFACLHLVAWNFFGSDLKNLKLVTELRSAGYPAELYFLEKQMSGMYQDVETGEKHEVRKVDANDLLQENPD